MSVTETDHRPVGLREGRWEYRPTAGSAFRLAREALQLTRAEMAAEVGISTGHLGRIERDERRCDRDSALYWRMVRAIASTMADRYRAPAAS